MIDAITLIRPMPAAIVWGSKDIENRPRDLPKRMRGVPTIVAVHAGKKWDERYAETLSDIDGVDSKFLAGAKVLPYANRLADEGLVGLMLLSGRVYTAENRPTVVSGLGEYDNPWFFGPYGYEIVAKVAFEKPIPAKGALGWWPVPDGAEAAIRKMDAWRGFESVVANNRDRWSEYLRTYDQMRAAA